MERILSIPFQRQRKSGQESQAADHLGPGQPPELLRLDRDSLEEVLAALPPAVTGGRSLRQPGPAHCLRERVAVAQALHEALAAPQ